MIGIFFGSSSGNTENAANAIAAALGVSSDNVFNVGETSADTVAQFDTLLLGSSTWGDGELQDDWFSFIDDLKEQDLSGKKVAIFGCGDSDSNPDTFCGAIAEIYNALQDSGATFVGQYTPEGYQVTDSAVCVDGQFLGLALDGADEDSHADRIAAWVELVK